MGLAAKQPSGPPSRDGIHFILPRKVPRLAPAFENLPCAGALLATGSGRTYMAGASLRGHRRDVASRLRRHRLCYRSLCVSSERADGEVDSRAVRSNCVSLMGLDDRSTSKPVKLIGF